MDEKLPRLSKRLHCAAALVRDGARAADVGCDHGKLAAWLVCSGRAASVVATDINPMPLQKARDLFAALGIEDRARTVLCAGLDGVGSDAADDIVIAGIGSDVTCSVIDNAPWLRDADKRLILLPASHHERVRQYLYLNGFALLGEIAVYDAGHCYSAMHARYCGEKTDIDPVFAALGKIRPDTDDAVTYYLHERKKAQRVLDNTDQPDKAARAARILAYIGRELL